MKRLVLFAALAACGGGSVAPAKEPTPPAPPPEDVVAGTGAVECDALVSRTECMFDKSGDAVPPEARGSFSEGVTTWKAQLANEDTRSAVIEACRSGLDAAYAGYVALGCWQQGDEFDGYVAPEPDAYAYEADPGGYTTFTSTGNEHCDALIGRTMCMYDKAGEGVPEEARKAFLDGVSAWSDALRNETTRQATIDACRMSLEAANEGYEAVGC